MREVVSLYQWEILLSKTEDPSGCGFRCACPHYLGRVWTVRGGVRWSGGCDRPVQPGPAGGLGGCPSDYPVRAGANEQDRFDAGGGRVWMVQFDAAAYQSGSAACPAAAPPIGVDASPTAPPARGPEFAPPASTLSSLLTQTVDDLVITFSAQPNKPGANIFIVRAVSTRRPPPAEVLRVILRFTFQGQDLGTETVDAVATDPGVYRVGGNYLSIAGEWNVEAVVRRQGIQDSVATFDWTVAPAVETRPLLISNRPWGTLLMAASAAHKGLNYDFG